MIQLALPLPTASSIIRRARSLFREQIEAARPAIERYGLGPVITIGRDRRELVRLIDGTPSRRTED